MVHHGSRRHIRERAVERAALPAAADPIIASERGGGEVRKRLVRLTPGLFIGAAVAVIWAILASRTRR